MKRLSSYLALSFSLLAVVGIQANENSELSVAKVIKVISDGEVHGQVFAMLDNVKAPLVGKVSLTDSEGNTISTSRTDDEGNFSFKDVEPGSYKAIGVSGDYVGDADVEVLSVAVKETKPEESEGVYTAIPLAVAPAPSSAIFETYASLPAASFSSAPSFGLGGGVGGCGSCGGGNGGGFGLQSFGGGCGGGCGGCLGGGFNFRRLALIGGAIAIPLALSGGNDDPATSAE